MPSRRSLLFLSALLLVSCAGEPQRSAKGTIDGPPKIPILIGDIPDAVPKPDPILEQGNFSPYIVNGVTYEVLDEYKNYSSEGLASWYGMKFHGRKTANGEIFDVALATAAHKSLPIPCYVKVINLENGLSLIVRVNDRGPFHPDRIIDLSYAAAKKLDFVDQGVTRVKVSYINVLGTDDRRRNNAGEYRHLQLGAFRSKFAADILMRKIQVVSKSPVSVSPVQLGKLILYRVRVGPFSSTSEVFTEKKILELEGFSELQPLP